MLPIFQDKAKELSVILDKAIEGEDKGVVEGTIINLIILLCIYLVYEEQPLT